MSFPDRHALLLTLTELISKPLNDITIIELYSSGIVITAIWMIGGDAGILLVVIMANAGANGYAKIRAAWSMLSVENFTHLNR